MKFPSSHSLLLFAPYLKSTLVRKRIRFENFATLVLFNLHSLTLKKVFIFHGQPFLSSPLFELCHTQMNVCYLNELYSEFKILFRAYIFRCWNRTTTSSSFSNVFFGIRQLPIFIAHTFNLFSPPFVCGKERTFCVSLIAHIIAYTLYAPFFGLLLGPWQTVKKYSKNERYEYIR